MLILAIKWMQTTYIFIQHPVLVNNRHPLFLQFNPSWSKVYPIAIKFKDIIYPIPENCYNVVDPNTIELNLLFHVKSKN